MNVIWRFAESFNTSGNMVEIPLDDVFLFVSTCGSVTPLYSTSGYEITNNNSSCLFTSFIFDCAWHHMTLQHNSYLIKPKGQFILVRLHVKKQTVCLHDKSDVLNMNNKLDRDKIVRYHSCTYSSNWRLAEDFFLLRASFEALHTGLQLNAFTWGSYETLSKPTLYGYNKAVFLSRRRWDFITDNITSSWSS